MLYRLLIFLGLWLVSWASAQTFDPSNPKAFLDVLGGNPCYLGFILFGIVASAKRSAERRQYKASPFTWKLLAFSSGLSISLLIHAFTDTAVLFVNGWVGAVLFGVTAGGIAIIGRDGAKTIISWGAAIISAALAPGLLTLSPAVPVPAPSPAPVDPSQAAQVTPVPAEPATALPSPANPPAPEVAPIPGDPAMLNLMSLLTAALSLGAAAPTPAQVSVLDVWTDTWLPKFKADVLALGDGITPGEVLTLVGDVIPAANQLQGTFKGFDRADVVGVTVRFVVQEFAPAALQQILAPILASGVLEGMIEAKYRELFPEKPVVNAPELPSGEAIQ